MDAQSRLADRFQAHRTELRALAYRMLGSIHEADDAVQEAWFRLSRTDADEVENLVAWLRTVVSRICLDILRSRKSHPEELIGQRLPEQTPAAAQANQGNQANRSIDPEEEVLLIDSVGRAMLVVLATLAPVERVAFVLHDMFAVPFDQIAPIVDRTPATAKKLASRARLKVRGTPAVPSAEIARQRQVVDAFLAASRDGDLAALLAVLAPDVVRQADLAALPPGAAAIVRGAQAVAKATMIFGRRGVFAEAVLVNGAVGVVVAPHGHLALALIVTVEGERITAYDVVADPARLCELDLAVLDD